MIRKITLAALMCGLCFSVSGVRAQQPSPAARDKRSLIVYKGDLAALLAQLALQYKVNIGFETIPSQPRPAIELDTHFTTLEELLDAIIVADPRYQWRNSDGFIDVFPKAGSCALLDTTISTFQISNTGWSMATEILTSLPEVQSQMSALHLSRRDFPRDSHNSSVNLLSISLKEVTLRRALHEMMKASGGSFWIFERPRGTEFFSISN